MNTRGQKIQLIHPQRRRRIRRGWRAVPGATRRQAPDRRIGKFYVFLREIRAELFDEAFRGGISGRLSAARRGAVAAGVAGDGDVAAGLRSGRRCGGGRHRAGRPAVAVGAGVPRGRAQAPFSQGALVKFRARMIAHDLDQKLLDRTVTLAKQTGRFGWQALRAALDSSPLIGAGRVEDTWNLIGRALRTVATCAAKTLKISRDQVLRDAGVTLLGPASLKAALDIDWGDPAAQADALARLLGEVDRLEQWVTRQVPVAEAPPVQAALAALRRVLTQDLEPDPTTGQRRIRRGVAAERMPSLGDPEMRHGRKTRTRLFTGYKRHVMKLVDADVIVGAIVRPANEPEHEALALADARPGAARTARRIADRSRLLGQSRHWRPPRARGRDSRQSVDEYQSGPVSEVRVCDPARRGARHVSRAADRADRPRRPHRALRRRRLPALLAARGLHHRPRRTLDRDSPAGSLAPVAPRAPAAARGPDAVSVSGRPSNTRWPASISCKDRRRATKAFARTPSMSDASPSWRTSSELPDSPRPREFMCSALSPDREEVQSP